MDDSIQSNTEAGGFTVGGLARHKTGGPVMVVVGLPRPLPEGYSKDDWGDLSETIQCTWFDGNRVMHRGFHMRSIVSLQVIEARGNESN